MAAELTTYEGRAHRRPPGASILTQQIYRLLHEHPEGMTRDELWLELREGWMDTDAYRAYERYRAAAHQRHLKMKMANASLNAPMGAAIPIEY